MLKLSVRGDLPGKECLCTPSVITNAEADIRCAIFCIDMWPCVGNVRGAGGVLNQISVGDNIQMLLTFDMDVLGFSEDNVLPGRNSEDPGVSVPVHSDNGANSTIDVVWLSIGLKSLIMDHKALQRITEEDDLIHLEDDGHDRWIRWFAGLFGGSQWKQSNRESGLICYTVILS